MKKILRIVLLAVCIPVFANYPSSTSSNDSYDIAGIYEKIELEDGAKAVDSYGNITDAEAVLVPAKFQTGNFEVELTRVDGNFYQICGTSQYIETRYCYEYAIRDKAVLRITSRHGYTLGEVIFLD